MTWEIVGVEEFLRDYPGMSVAPAHGSELKFRGIFKFIAKTEGKPTIEDSYSLEIIIPQTFPACLPEVRETKNKIPNNGQFHINGDGTLCLGSPLRLLKVINENKSLAGFTDKCLVPFLYACSHKIEHGGEFVFSDLRHGEPGIIDDYLDIFHLSNPEEVPRTIELLGMKKRISNKKVCPCGCGNRVGACSLHHRLNGFRKMAPRSWFKAHASNLGRGM